MDTTTIYSCYNETYLLNDGTHVNCEIMDTGGQEKFDALNRQYYQRADCCILVYDITDSESFNQCETFYKQEIINNCKKDINVILVGNKTDKEKERKITNEQGANLAKENGYCFEETSCETNCNVANAFETIIIMTVNNIKKNEQNNMNTTIKLTKDNLIKEDSNANDKTKKNKNKKKCC